MPKGRKKPVKKGLIQSTPNLNEQNIKATNKIIEVNIIQEEDTGVDERHYYHQSEENPNYVAKENKIGGDKRILKKGNNGLVVNKPDINIKIKQQVSHNVYHFDEEGGDISGVTEKISKLHPKRCRYSQSYTCPFCSYTNPKRYLVVRHMRIHSNKNRYKCKICDRGFTTSACLQNHVNVHEGVKPHTCKHCSKPFTTSGELVRHVKYKHTLEKPHKCTECDYASVELSKLKRHVRCHTGERPYQCPHCEHAFTDNCKLKRHLRIHTGEKPYKCEQCKTSFTQSNSLKIHNARMHNVSQQPVDNCEVNAEKCERKAGLHSRMQKLHYSDKPVKCTKCKKSFPDKHSFKKHNKQHEDKKCYSCELCSYASVNIQRLKSHMLKHKDKKPFICSKCNQCFRRKQLLQRHQNLHHNAKSKPKSPEEKKYSCHDCGHIFAHKGNLIQHLEVHTRNQKPILATKITRQIKNELVEFHVTDNGASDQNLKLKTEIKQEKDITVTGGNEQQYKEVDSTGEQNVADLTPNYIKGENVVGVDNIKYELPDKEKYLDRSIKLEVDIGCYEGEQRDDDN